MLRQQQPCSDDPVGTLQPDGTGARLLLIRDFRARAEGRPGREAASLDDIPWSERILAETPAFEQGNRR